MITKMTPMATPQRTNFKGFAKSGEFGTTALDRAMQKQHQERVEAAQARHRKRTELLKEIARSAVQNLSEHTGIAPQHMDLFR